MQGLVKNFLLEDGGSGVRRVSIQEDGMGDMFGSRHDVTYTYHTKLVMI